MRSLLVFLHLVVLVRLTEGVPVPVTANDILECVSHVGALLVSYVSAPN